MLTLVRRGRYRARIPPFVFPGAAVRVFFTFCVILFVMLGMPLWIALFVATIVISLWISWMTREIIAYRRRRR